MAKKDDKIIRQYDKAGNHIKDWDPDKYSLRDIAKALGHENGQGKITEVLSGKKPSIWGFSFKKVDRPQLADIIFNTAPIRKIDPKVGFKAPAITDVDGHALNVEDIDADYYKMIDFKAFNEKVCSLLYLDQKTKRVRSSKEWGEGCLNPVLTYPEVKVKIHTGQSTWQRWSSYDTDPIIILTVRYYQLKYGQDDPDFWNADNLDYILFIGRDILNHNPHWLELCVSRAWYRAVRDGNGFVKNFYGKFLSTGKDDPWPFECKDYIIDDINWRKPEILRQYRSTGGYLERPVSTTGEEKPYDASMFDEAVYEPN